MFKPFHQQSAFVIDAGIVGPTQALPIARPQDRASRVEKLLRQLEVILAVEETEETGPIVVSLVVCVIDDGRDPPDRLVPRARQQRINLTGESVKRRFGGKIFDDAAGKGRNERGIETMESLGQTLKKPLLLSGLAQTNRVILAEKERRSNGSGSSE